MPGCTVAAHPSSSHLPCSPAKPKGQACRLGPSLHHMHLAGRVFHLSSLHPSTQSDLPGPFQEFNSINALEIQDCLLLGFDTQLPQDACHLPVQVIKPRLSLQCIFLYLHGPIDPRRLGDTTTMMAVVQLSSIVVPFTLISRIQTGISQVDPEVFILQCWVGRTSLGPLSLSQVPDMIGLSNIHRCQVGLGEITWGKKQTTANLLGRIVFHRPFVLRRILGRRFNHTTALLLIIDALPPAVVRLFSSAQLTDSTRRYFPATKTIRTSSQPISALLIAAVIMATGPTLDHQRPSCGICRSC